MASAWLINRKDQLPKGPGSPGTLPHAGALGAKYARLAATTD